MPKKPEAKIQKTSSARPVKRTPARTAKAAKSAAPKAAAKSSPKASPARAGTKAPRAQSSQAVTQLVDALKGHPQQKDLVTAGQQQKDQLLRSLIPLYLARAINLEVTSGTTSRFWGTFGVSYAAPNAAKALRMNTGYAQETRKGKAITAKGVRYVEQALKQLRPN